MYPHGETVTVERAGGTDQWGDPLPGTEFQRHGVAFAPRTSSEQNSQGNTVIVGLTMFDAYDADLRPTDVIRRADGRRYQVVGEPGPWRSPLTGWEAGVEVALERVTG